MSKVLVALVVSMFTLVSHAEVRWNVMTRIWEGNICSSPYAWTYVPWQPIGTLCVIRMPNGLLVQGMIINQ